MPPFAENLLLPLPSVVLRTNTASDRKSPAEIAYSAVRMPDARPSTTIDEHIRDAETAGSQFRSRPNFDSGSDFHRSSLLHSHLIEFADINYVVGNEVSRGHYQLSDMITRPLIGGMPTRNRWIGRHAYARI